MQGAAPCAGTAQTPGRGVGKGKAAAWERNKNTRDTTANKASSANRQHQEGSSTCKGCSHLTETTAPPPWSSKALGSYSHVFSLFPGQQDAEHSMHDLTLLWMQNSNCSPLIFQINLSHCSIAASIVTLFCSHRRLSA